LLDAREFALSAEVIDRLRWLLWHHGGANDAAAQGRRQTDQRTTTERAEA
jgi:hypothetical protein